MEFSPDVKMRKISALAEEVFAHVLDGEEPFFVSDEATIWDVSMAAPDELIQKCSEYCGRPVSLEELKQPLWKLLPKLSAARVVAKKNQPDNGVE